MKKQKGMVTLLSSLILIILITLLVFWGARGSIIEQQSANNSYLTQVAFQNAEQGRVLFFSNMNNYLTANPTTEFDAALSSAQQTTNNAAGGKFTVAYQIAADNVTATLTSTGNSIGGTTRKVSQRLTFTAGSGIGPAALVSLGNITLGGSTTASSATAGGTIVGNVGTSGSPSTATSNSNEFKVQLLDHAGNVLRDSAGNPVTRGMTTDEYFIYYFGGFCPVAKAAYATDISRAVDCKPEAKASVAANPKGYICASNCGSKTEDDKIKTAYDAGKRIFWLSSGGIDHKYDMGTEVDPVLIFVMGMASGSNGVKINANSTIFGVLYVDIADTRLNIGCSCNAQDTVTAVTSSPRYVQVDDTTKPIYGDDTSKPIFTAVSTGGVKCNTNGGCTDSQGHTIPKNGRYTVTYQQKITGYQQMTIQQGTYTSAATWSSIVYGLNASQPAACTVAACSASSSKCTPPNTLLPTTAVGDQSICSYSVPAVSGTSDVPVEVEVLGDWNAGGSGNATFQGSVISSGNINVTGNATYLQNSTVVTNQIFGQGGGTGFTPKPPTLAVAQNSWSDMLN